MVARYIFLFMCLLITTALCTRVHNILCHLLNSIMWLAACFLFLIWCLATVHSSPQFNNSVNSSSINPSLLPPLPSTLLLWPPNGLLVPLFFWSPACRRPGPSPQPWWALGLARALSLPGLSPFHLVVARCLLPFK